MPESTARDIKKMLSHSDNPSMVVSNLYDYQEEHKAKFLDWIGRGFVVHFEHGFDVLAKMMYYLNFTPKEKRPEHRAFQWLIIKNNIPSLFYAFQNLHFGSYDATNAIIRSLFESIIKIFFVSLYPEDKESVLYKRKGKQFQIKTFLENDLKVKRHDNYMRLSIIAHCNGEKTLKDFVNIAKEGQKGLINIEMKWDSDEISRQVNYINFVMRGYLLLIKELFIVHSHMKKNTELYNNLIDTERAFSGLIKETPNRFGTTMHGDLLKIIRKIKKTEKKREDKE